MSWGTRKRGMGSRKASLGERVTDRVLGIAKG